VNGRPWTGIIIGLAAGWLLAPVLSGAEPAGTPPANEEVPMAPTVQEGTTVEIDYTLTVDGAVVDSSKGRAPLSYVHGQGQLIPGLEKQLIGLKAGDARSLTVSPEEGYGPVDPEAFVEVSREQLPPDLTPEVGLPLRGTGPDGRPFRATVYKVGSESVTLDLNHPLAGKTLSFDITVVTVSPAQGR
jgi:FKBP-type peptidyl-prolyl cis-trans isomerase SlyD